MPTDPILSGKSRTGFPERIVTRGKTDPYRRSAILVRLLSTAVSDKFKKHKQNMEAENELLVNLNKLHTTELGTERLRKNLSLSLNDNVVGWCKEKIKSAHAVITRNGKNWYIHADDCIITVNAYSYTVITAHRKKTHDTMCEPETFSMIGRTEHTN